MWHKYANFAVLNYIMSYHKSIGCELTHCCVNTIRTMSQSRSEHSSAEVTHATFANCFSCHWVKRNYLSRFLQKCYANRHQLQSVLRQDMKQLDSESLAIFQRFTSESDLSWKRSSFPRISLHWSLKCWKSSTKQQINSF